MRAAPVVHLELHTADRRGAGALYSQLLGWRPERIDTRSGTYVALELGAGFGGGIVECGTRRALWLPYVEVPDVDTAAGTAWPLPSPGARCSALLWWCRPRCWSPRNRRH